MASVEIHVPITMNEHFSVMSCMLVRSLEKNANLGPDWQVIITTSLDSVLTEDSEEFKWTKSFPVTFRPVEKELWKRMKYDGTGLHAIMSEHVADVVLYMDADTLVANSIRDVVETIAESESIFGWQAWFSPPIDFNALFQRAGITNPKYEHRYSGYGIDFISPEWAPPYFNFGFLGMPRKLANNFGKSFARDLEFVFEYFPNYFASQVALTLCILRNRYDYHLLDGRYNLGNADITPPKFTERQYIELYERAIATIDDPRVFHYCVSTDAFQKKRDMATWKSLDYFVNKPGLSGLQLLLQEELRQLL